MDKYRYTIHFDNGKEYSFTSDKEIEFAREGITIINDNLNGFNITVYMNKVSLIEFKLLCKQ